MRISDDVSKLGAWITAANNNLLPPTFTDQLSREYASLLLSPFFQCLVIEIEGTPVLLVEIYHENFAGMIPVDVNTEENALLLKWFFNPLEDHGVVRTCLHHLLQMAHDGGTSNIWMEIEKGSMEETIAYKCGFSKVEKYELLVHRKDAKQ